MKNSPLSCRELMRSAHQLKRQPQSCRFFLLCSAPLALEVPIAAGIGTRATASKNLTATSSLASRSRFLQNVEAAKEGSTRPKSKNQRDMISNRASRKKKITARRVQRDQRLRFQQALWWYRPLLTPMKYVLSASRSHRRSGRQPRCPTCQRVV